MLLGAGIRGEHDPASRYRATGRRRSRSASDNAEILGGPLRPAGGVNRDLIFYSVPRRCGPQQFPGHQETSSRCFEERTRPHFTTPLTLSVHGCVVNGPGEYGAARTTDSGFTRRRQTDTHQVSDSKRHRRPPALKGSKTSSTTLVGRGSKKKAAAIGRPPRARGRSRRPRAGAINGVSRGRGRGGVA